MRVTSEVESKFELDESGFEKLKSAGRIVACVRQLNVYFDRNWTLAKNEVTFRVRFASGSPPEATLKVPVRRRGATRTMREIEIRLREDPANNRIGVMPHRHIDVSRDLPSPIGTELLRLGVKSLERVGWMRNTRYLITVDSGGQMELDRTTLPDGSSVFEAEIESSDSSVQRKLSRFVLNTVPYAQPSRVSKFQRFREAAESLAQVKEIPKGTRPGLSKAAVSETGSALEGLGKLLRRLIHRSK